MGLASGTRLGAYEIVAILGAGGMGEVYRARDTKLGRVVAVKVLLDQFVADPDRASRFEREAKVLAALNHPRIATLFGMEEAAGRHFLVMELVEGDTLADRIQRGRLPTAVALNLAIQIAEALEAAHEKGIVHRDLKPANIKITPDEAVKVLDFGLAKAIEDERAPSNLTQSPTLSLKATQAGVILGTAAYMSPEQAKGFPADHRSDIFAFGIVLFEMLAGRQPFHGETAPEILAAVLVREPPLDALPPNLNPRLVELVRRCLEKNPKKRWQAIGDVRAELESIAAHPHAVVLPPARVAPPRPLWVRVLPFIATAIVSGLLVAAVMWRLEPAATMKAITRFDVPLDETQVFTNAGRTIIAVSPDGTKIVYVANSRLYLKLFSDATANPIPGSETAGAVLNPVFSPDGQWVAFWAAADQTVRRIAVTGGAPVRICAAEIPLGLSWNENAILIGAGSKGILRVSSNGGEPETVATVGADEVAHGPQALPNGHGIIFTIAKGTEGTRWDDASIVAQRADGTRRVILTGGSDARYVATGHLVYAHSGVLFAVRFDPATFETHGAVVPVVDGVRRGGFATGAAHYGFSETGTLVYVPGPAVAMSADQSLGFFERTTGQMRATTAAPGPYESPRLSPDGTRIAFNSTGGTDVAIWIFDVKGGMAPRKLTFGGINRNPAWAPDSRHIAFQSNRDGDNAIYRQVADGTQKAERLTSPVHGATHSPDDWSPDGATLLYDVETNGLYALWMLSIADRRTTSLPGIESSVSPTNAVFSPDGRWFAYTHRERSTRNVIYIQPFPPTGAKYQVSKSVDDGHHPLFSPDGRELFFVPGPGRFVAVPIQTTPVFDAGEEIPITRTFNITSGDACRTFDVSRDGHSFVGFITGAQSAAAKANVSNSRLSVVLNWFEDLKQRVR